MELYIKKRHELFDQDFRSGLKAYCNGDSQDASRSLRPALERLATIIICDVYSEQICSELYNGERMFMKNLQRFDLRKVQTQKKEGGYKISLMYQSVLSKLPDNTEKSIISQITTANVVFSNFYNSASEYMHESNARVDMEYQISAFLAFLRCFIDALVLCGMLSKRTCALFATFNLAQVVTESLSDLELQKELLQLYPNLEQASREESMESTVGELATCEDSIVHESTSADKPNEPENLVNINIIGQMSLKELDRLYTPYYSHSQEATTENNDTIDYDESVHRGICYKNNTISYIADVNTGWTYKVEKSEMKNFFDGQEVFFELKDVPNLKNPDKSYYIPINIKPID